MTSALEILRTCSREELADPEFVLQQGHAFFHYADLSLRNSVTFMTRAVEKDGNFLMFASNSIKRNRAIVLGAIKSQARALFHVLPESLRRCRMFLLEAVACNPEVYRVVADSIRPWTDLDGSLSIEADAGFCSEKDWALAACKQNGLLLRYASRQHRADSEVVTEAAKNNRGALQFASDFSRETVAHQFGEQLAPSLVDLLAARSLTNEGVLMRLTGDPVRLTLRYLGARDVFKLTACARIAVGCGR